MEDKKKKKIEEETQKQKRKEEREAKRKEKADAARQQTAKGKGKGKGKGKSSGEKRKRDESGNDDDLCTSCHGEYVEGERWIACDNCDLWFHITCTDIEDPLELEEEELEELVWECEECL